MEPRHAEDQILDYLDGKLSPAAKQQFENLLRANPALQARVEEIRMIEYSLRSIVVAEKPSKNFTHLVMTNLDREPGRVFFSIRRSLLLLAGILAVCGFGAMLLATGAFDSLQTTVNLDSLNNNKPFEMPALPSFSLSGKLLVNTIVILNLVVAFLVLDRAVLKPYFQRRKNLI